MFYVVEQHNIPVRMFTDGTYIQVTICIAEAMRMVMDNDPVSLTEEDRNSTCSLVEGDEILIISSFGVQEDLEFKLMTKLDENVLKTMAQYPNICKRK